MTIRTVHMDFLYGGAFRTGMPEAYERLILDTLLGDGTLFTRADEVEEQWLLVDSIVVGVAARPPELPELRGRHVGPAERRRPAAPRRPLLEAALSAPAVIESWDGDGRQARRRRAALAQLRAATATPGAAAEHPHVGDDAHRVGAGGVARPGARRARRHGRAPSVAHDPARTRSPTPARTGSTRRSRSSATRCRASERSICSEVIELAAARARARRRRRRSSSRC